MSIYLYYCNIIDYFRLLLLLLSIFTSNKMFILLYGIAAGLDYFDGKLARQYNQATFFGACFDMFIDRLSTLTLVFKITERGRKKSTLIFFLYFIDLLSHLLFFTISNKLGSHHKSVGANIFMQIYYNSTFLFLICFLSELSLMGVYYSKKSHTLLLLPYVLKTFFHLLHLYEALCMFEKIN